MSKEEFSIEDLDSVLDYPTIEVLPSPDTGGFFNRSRFFKVGENEYQIVWYCNISYLFGPGNITMLFYQAKLSNTWPHRSKMNIQFYDEKGDVCGVIKIDDYDKAES